MKTTVLVLLMISAARFGLVAQENITDVREKLIFGMRAGLNYSNVYDTEGESFQADPKIGAAAGIFVAIPLWSYFGIQPEAMFSQKGFKGSGVLMGTSYNMTRTSNYFDFPLFFAFKPSEFITLLAGPQFSYLVKQTDSFKNAGTNVAQETEYENDNIRNNTLCASLGVDLTMKHMLVSARAGWDLLQNKDDGSSLAPRYKNTWLQATIGYRLY